MKRIPSLDATAYPESVIGSTNKEGDLRVFVCEFVTGGGMRGECLPSSLAREGTMMRDALIADLRGLADVHVSTTHDDRLPPPPMADSEPVGANAEPWSIWSRAAARCNLVWPIAPETGGVLERLTRLLGSSGTAWIGPDAETVRIAASKIRTARLLEEHGVPTVPTYRVDELPVGVPPPFITKPDDGAGCLETRLWNVLPAGLVDPGIVVQPFIEGVPASLCIACDDKRAVLLSANRQHIEIRDASLHLSGVTVGAIEDNGRLCRLAQAVLGAMPGLRGIIGVDLILTPARPMVVDVNPRLTTSYVGLHRFLGVNPVKFVPELTKNIGKILLPQQFRSPTYVSA